MHKEGKNYCWIIAMYTFMYIYTLKVLPYIPAWLFTV